MPGGVRVCVATRLDAAPILAGEEERGMANFLEYNPEQAYLLPPTVREVLGEGHLCFFVHGAVEKLDLQELEAGYSDEAHSGRFGVSLFGGRGAAGFLGAERVSQAARASDERHLHAGGGVGALAGTGEAGARSHRLHAHCGQRRDERHGDPGKAASGTLAVSDDHLIVAQQVSRELNDNGLLVPMVDKVQHECGEPPGQVSADSGFFSLHNLEVMEERGIDAYVPDSNMACVLHHGGMLKQPTRHPPLLRMRSKLASTTGRALYRRRKALAEPVIGILKEQRGMRRFRMRGLGKVAAEFALATTALNLTRMWRLSPPGKRSA